MRTILRKKTKQMKIGNWKMMHIATMLAVASFSRVHATSALSCVSSSARRSAFLSYTGRSLNRRHQHRLCSKSSDEETEQLINVSRLSTLQTLLSRRGAPGSIGCNQGDGDLVPVAAASSSEYRDLHPHLFPLAQSASSGNVVCALRRPHADDAAYDGPSPAAPWPLVESAVGLSGIRLLALNSEHLMRRIAADADANLAGDAAAAVVDLYNAGLGAGRLDDASLDAPYELGSVAQLGYGLDKYALLRVGPFPDLYETMANQHLARGDEESALIAAETANGKFSGFGSTFAFYAKLLGSLPRREEECRDAARVTLRLPLPSLGMARKEFVDVARMCDFASADDDGDVALAKMLEMYEKIRDHERDENSGDKSPKQTAMEDANYLLDTACLTGNKYGDLRQKIADIYRAAGMEEDARFAEQFC